MDSEPEEVSIALEEGQGASSSNLGTDSSSTGSGTYRELFLSPGAVVKLASFPAQGVLRATLLSLLILPRMFIFSPLHAQGGYHSAPSPTISSDFLVPKFCSVLQLEAPPPNSVCSSNNFQQVIYLHLVLF